MKERKRERKDGILLFPRHACLILVLCSSAHVDLLLIVLSAAITHRAGSAVLQYRGGGAGSLLPCHGRAAVWHCR